MSADNIRCVLCFAFLQDPCFRRVLCGGGSSSNEAEIYQAFIRLVQPNFQSGNSISYICKNTCFATLKKLCSHTKTVNSLLTKLGAPLLPAWRQSCTVGTLCTIEEPNLFEEEKLVSISRQFHHAGIQNLSNLSNLSNSNHSSTGCSHDETPLCIGCKDILCITFFSQQ